MTLSVGDKIPEHNFHINGADGPAVLSTADLCAGKKVIIIGLPAAFSGTCSGSHVPGYLENLDALKEKGIDQVAVTSVNDFYVMGAWAKSMNADGKVEFLCDGNADFANAAGLNMDMTGMGWGMRSKRYAMLVEDGVVTKLNIEENPGEAVQSGAAAMLEQL